MEYKNKWLISYETLLFDTADEDLSIDQYAPDGGGTGYYIRTVPTTQGHFIHIDLDLKDREGNIYTLAKLTEVKIVLGAHAYYDEFLTAAGATNLWTANSIYAGKSAGTLPSGSVLRIRSTAKKYWDTAQIKDHLQPLRTEKVEVLPPFEPLPETPARHSIGFDATSNSGSVGAVSSYSFSHTCGATANLLAFGDGHYLSSGDRMVTGVTYNAVAMTPIRSDVQAGSGYYFRSTVYYLLAPATGSAKTVAVTYSGTITQGGGGVVSYSGAKQSGQPDANNGAAGQSSTIAQVTVTTIADNCWVFSCAMMDSYPLTCYNTVRYNVNFFGGSDTGAPKTPAGGQLMKWSAAAASLWAISAASFAPAVGWTYIAKVNGVAKAAISKINGVPLANINKINGVA